MDYAGKAMFIFLNIAIFLFYAIVFGILQGVNGIIIWTVIAAVLFTLLMIWANSG